MCNPPGRTYIPNEKSRERTTEINKKKQVLNMLSQSTILQKTEEQMQKTKPSNTHPTSREDLREVPKQKKG